MARATISETSREIRPVQSSLRVRVDAGRWSKGYGVLKKPHESRIMACGRWQARSLIKSINWAPRKTVLKYHIAYIYRSRRRITTRYLGNGAFRFDALRVSSTAATSDDDDHRCHVYIVIACTIAVIDVSWCNIKSNDDPSSAFSSLVPVDRNWFSAWCPRFYRVTTHLNLYQVFKRLIIK